MNCNELCERFNLSTSTIKELKKAQLINCENYDNNDIDRLNHILTLKNAGISLNKIKEFIDLDDSDKRSIHSKEKILTDQRKFYSESLHDIQKYLDRIDYLIYQLKQDQ